MNIYLDIDGVLLANENNLAIGAEEFIEFVVKNYPTYWLTTHCMDGDPSLAVENVGRLCKPKTVEFLKRIKPTKWKVAKTEAIDFSEPFLWFDDDLYPEEKQVLNENDSIKSFVEVNLYKDSNQLNMFLERFPSA